MPPPQQLLSSSLSFKCLNFYLKVYLILLFILISALLPLSAPSDCDEARQWPNFCFALKNSTLLSDSAQKELTIREGRAQEMFCDMARLLTKIDCNQPYSVNQEQSRQCQEAYRDWACSVIVESFMEEREFGKSVHKPLSLMPFPSCDSVCHRVLRVCPYLTPDRNQLSITGHPALHPSQYGGHPAFYCPIRSGLFFADFKAARSGGGGLGTEQHPVHHRYFYRSGTKVNLNDDLITSNDTSCCWTYSAALKTEQYGLYNSDDPSQTDLEDIIKSFSYNDGDHEDGGFGDLHKIPYRELLGTANQVQIQCLHVERPKHTQTLSSSSSSAAHHSQISEADAEFQEEEEEEHSALQPHPQVLARTDFTSSAHLLHSPKSGNGGSGHGKGKEPSSPHSHSQSSGQALSRPMSRSVNTQDTEDMVAKLHRSEQTPLIPSQDSSESNYNYLHDDWFDVVSPRSKSIQKRNNYNFLNLASSSSSSSHPASKKEEKQSEQHEEERQQEPSSVLNSEVSGEEDDRVSLYDGQDGVEGLEEDLEDPDADLLDGDEALDHQGSSDLDGEEGTMSTRSSEDSPHRRRQEGAMMDQDFISTVSVRIERSISSLSSAPEHPSSSAKSSGSRPELFIEKLLPFRVRSVSVNLSRFRFTNILPLPSFLTNVLNVVTANANANKNTNTIHHHNNHHNRCFPLLLFNILLLLIIILLLIILVLLTTNFLPILLQILYTTAHYVSSYSPHSSSSKSAAVQFPRRTSRTRTRLRRLPPPEKGSWTRRERNSLYINYEDMGVREGEGEGNDEEYDDELTRGGSGGGEVTQFSAAAAVAPQPQPNNDPPPLLSSSAPLSEHQHYYESETKHPPYYTGRPGSSMSRTFSQSNNNNTNKIILKRINTDSTGRQTLDKHTKHTYYTNKIITTNTSIILSGQIILISKQINTTTPPKQTLTVNNLRSESSQYNYYYYYYGQACHSCDYSSYHSQLVASSLMISSQLQLLGHFHLLSSHLQFLLLLLSKSTHLIDVVPLSATLLLLVNVNETKIEKVYGVVEVDWGGFVDRDNYSKCGGNNYCVLQLSGRVVQKMSLVWTFLSVLEMERRRQLTSALILNSSCYISSSPSLLTLTMKLKSDNTTVLLGIVENLQCVKTTAGSSWFEGKEEEGNWPPLQLTKFKRFENSTKMKGYRELLRVWSVFSVAIIMNRELKLNVVAIAMVVRPFIKCRHPVYGSNYFSSNGNGFILIFFVNVIIRIRRKSHPIIISRLRFFHHLHYHYHHHPLRHHHFVWVVHRLSDVDEWTPDPLTDLPMLRHRHPLLFLKCTSTRIRMNIIIIVIMTDNDDTDNIASTFVTSILWLRYRNDNRSSGCRRTNIIRKIIRTCSSRSRRRQRCPHNSNSINNNSKTVSKMIKIKLENSSTMIVCNIDNKLKNKIILINILYSKNLEEVTCRNNNNVYYDSRPLLLSVVLLLTRLTLSLVRFMMIVTKSKLLVLELRWEKGKLLLLLRKLKSKVMRISMLLLLLYSTIHVFIPWENVLVIQILVLLLLLLLLLLLVVPQSHRHLQRLSHQERSTENKVLQQEQEEQDKLVIISQSHSYNQSYSYSNPNNNSSNYRIKTSHCYFYYYYCYCFDHQVTSCWRSVGIFMGMGVKNQNQGIILTDPHQLRDHQQKQHGQSISILPKTVSHNSDSDSSYKLLKCSQERQKLLLQEVLEEQMSEILVIVLSLPTTTVVLLLLPPPQHSMGNNQRSFSASNTITEVNYYYDYYYYYYRYNIITSHKHIDTL